MALDSQKPCRDERCGAKGVIEGNSHERYGIPDGSCQVEMRAGERSIFRDQPPVLQLDSPPHEFEMVLYRADCRHRITDKGNIASVFCRKGGPCNERIDMDTIENDARCQTLVGKRHPNNTGLSGAHGWHRIEQVRNSTKPVIGGPDQGVGSCFLMP